MFKRIAKKQKRQERDEELGLDEETKQVLGMHDTDSDESDSELEMDSDVRLDVGSEVSNSDDEGDSDTEDLSDAVLRSEWLVAEDDFASEDEDASDEEGLDLDDEEFEDDPPMSLEEAIEDPIYIVGADLETRACITCPKKLLKNSKMVEVHLKSSAHVRRFHKFCELAQTRKYSSKDPRNVTTALNKPSSTLRPKTSGMSNRGLKRKMKLDAIRKKRETLKIIMARKRKHSEKENTEVRDEGSGAEVEALKVADRPRKKRKVKEDKLPEQPVTDLQNASSAKKRIAPKSPIADSTSDATGTNHLTPGPASKDKKRSRKRKTSSLDVISHSSESKKSRKPVARYFGEEESPAKPSAEPNDESKIHRRHDWRGDEKGKVMSADRRRKKKGQEGTDVAKSLLIFD